MPPAPPTASVRPKSRRAPYDVAVIGGGINGCGIARDLAGRGFSVLLAEKDDLAAHTSSASTKLIHGGLRYLEHYEFSLVRKALAEREVLLKSAPHIMRPLRFVMPHDPSMRPAWMIRAGLFLYDHLARREVLPGSCSIDLRRHPTGAPLKASLTRGFVYSDGWVDDARLVALAALDAAERGATVLTRTRCTQARREAGQWRLRLEGRDGARQTLRARALVNAAGPWAAQFLREEAGIAAARSLRLVKGSHIVVAKLFDHDDAYIFQNADQRIIFAIPYQRDFTLIGTTDVEHKGPIGAAQIDAGEISYLCEQASHYFEQPVTPQQVVWTYSGVRPLLDDESNNPSVVTRDYRLELDTAQAPLLSVWGGKLTTFRKLSEEAGDRLGPRLGLQRGAWTEHAWLPGGDLSEGADGSSARPGASRRRPGAAVLGAFERFVEALQRRQPELPRALCRRLAHAYGSRVDRVLGGAAFGAEVAPGLFEAELHYLHDQEWACSAEDVLWRRSKLGLHYGEAERAAVAAWCERHWGEAA
jgi:glycerol-3-phosphate dehydrogenase